MNSLRDVVESVLLRRGHELEGLTQTKAGSRILVKITIDGDGSEGKGLTLDEIAETSKEISQVLDETSAMGNAAYVLEVGTRGVDAPLTKSSHWRRNTGRLVKITDVDGGKLTARILDSDDTSVTLSEDHIMEYTQIKKAIVQVEMNRDEQTKDEE
ncbi:MAG: ribosome maturation factor RimP [Propionibacteriaceae bacterium]|jgi:ribosome maturation factor RimP|nr:ribosome maturation factor RimP [Propionibacteriaceae bacterium]